MAVINLKEKIIQVKIVYYGPGRSGKTTNLVYIYNKLQEKLKDKMTNKLISINTKGDRTLFFDFLPVELGKIHGLDLKLQIYTTPGQLIYDVTRKLVLKGVDGLVFTADSLLVRREANLENLEILKRNLAYYNSSLEEIPIAFQWNKRDLAENGVPLLDIDTLETDLNAVLKAPSFPASALNGYNVLKTLKMAAKLTIQSVIKKLVLPEGMAKAIGS